jgi:hypothetical protein
MGQIGPTPKEGRVCDDSRRHDPERSSSGFSRPDTGKGVSALVPFRWNTDVFSPNSLTNGSSVRLRGTLTSSPGPGQDSELLAEAMEVLGVCNPEVHKILPACSGQLTL